MELQSGREEPKAEGTTGEAAMPPLLHLYAQPWAHGEAWVVGSEDGLRALRDALTKALEDGSSRAETMTADGEGYRVLVVKAEGEQRNLQLPYAEASDVAGNGEHPLRLIGTGKYQTLMRD